MATKLLKSCLAFPKISFSLRTCPPSYIRDATDSFDTLMFESFSDLVGGPLPDWSWTKAFLPTSLGCSTFVRPRYTPQLHTLGQSLPASFWCQRSYDIILVALLNSLKLFVSFLSYPGTQNGLHLMILIFLSNNTIFPKPLISPPLTPFSQTLLCLI